MILLTSEERPAEQREHKAVNELFDAQRNRNKWNNRKTKQFPRTPLPTLGNTCAATKLINMKSLSVINTGLAA